MDAANPSITLQSGDKMPVVGFGFWKVAGDQTAEITYQAIKSGYRCIDEACDYGNEKQCGEGLKRAIDEGIVKREDLFITSKLWNTYHRKEHVKDACKRSLSDLGVEQLDLYLIHFPIALKFVPFEKRYPPEWVHDTDAPVKCMEEDNVSIEETWTAMEELVKEGLVKNIGFSNFNCSLIREVLNFCTIKPAVLQVELHPYNTQEKLIRYCKEKGIAVTGFSNFGASSYVEIGMAAAEDCVLNDEGVKAIGAKHGKTAGQVALRWSTQRGYAIIPKTSKVERMAENRNLFDFTLSDEEMAQISGLNKNRRFNDPGHFTEIAFGTFFPIYE